MTNLLDRYKLVVRDKNGKVIQIHEVYREYVGMKVMEVIKDGELDHHSVTVSKLT